LSRGGGASILTGMKVDLYDAPLSPEAEKLLKDAGAIRELIIEITEDSARRRFQVKSGSKTFDVTASEAVLATSEN
jgi:hypothetical protein